MNVREVREIIGDISEAFNDIGTIEEEANIEWLPYKFTQFDSLYRQDVNKVFENAIEMVALVTGPQRKDVLENEGLEYEKIEKAYVTADYFTGNDLVPGSKDFLRHKGIVYNISKLRDIAIADQPLLYVVFLEEADFTKQSEEYREQLHPFFEPDVTQAETETGTTGTSGLSYADYPAEIISELSESSYEVITGLNDKFRLNLSGIAEEEIILPGGTHTNSEIVTILQDLFNTAFGVGNIIVALTPGEEISISTISTGPTATLEIVLVPGNCYLLFGFVVGVYRGEKKFDLEDDPNYDEEGDPV
jgi:hypothetical protein